MKNGYLVIIISLLWLCGCSTLGTKPTALNPCTPNLTESGNLFIGTVYKTSKEYSTISKANAFGKILSSMATNGYHINNSNKELGLISAGLPVIVIEGGGQTVPMNVIINEGNNKTIKVDTTISLTGGLAASGDEITNYFCSVYKALEN